MGISIHTPLAGSDEAGAAVLVKADVISIHTPLAGSDAALRKCWRSLIFQSTLPLRGATRPDNWTIWPTGYFNPHSPCGERRGWRCRSREGGCNFNPHSPCGERRGLAEMLEVLDISIHTPLAGSDQTRQLDDLADRVFQSTLPLRGATWTCSTSTTSTSFQSTLPLRGATGHCHTLLSGHAISIHTPLAGSDACLSHTLPASANFNPHSPCGERHVDAMPHSWVDIFQSTLPLRGATRVRGDGTTMLVISIHTPLAGSDRRNETFLTK